MEKEHSQNLKSNTTVNPHFHPTVLYLTPKNEERTDSIFYRITTLHTSLSCLHLPHTYTFTFPALP